MVFLCFVRSYVRHETRMATDQTYRRSRARWLYPLLLATTIVVASGRGQVAAPDIVHIDKVVHFSIFGLLASLVVRSPGMRHAWVSVLIVSLFGMSDEIRQSFTPGRSVEFADWVADSSGAALAVALYTFWGWYRRLLETPLHLRPRRAAGQDKQPSATDPLPVPSA